MITEVKKKKKLSEEWMNFKRIGNSLAIQWLRLHILNSGGTVQSMAGETKIT